MEKTINWTELEYHVRLTRKALATCSKASPSPTRSPRARTTPSEPRMTSTPNKSPEHLSPLRAPEIKKPGSTRSCPPSTKSPFIQSTRSLKVRDAFYYRNIFMIIFLKLHNFLRSTWVCINKIICLKLLYFLRSTCTWKKKALMFPFVLILFLHFIESV